MVANSTRIIVNPYRRSQEQRQRTAQTNAQAVAETTIKMGIQSQQREGAVKKCKKRGTRIKMKQRIVASSRQQAIDGTVAFDPIEHCIICKVKDLNARGIKTRAPKRSHHKACPKNRKTRGTSEMTVFVNKEAAKNLAANQMAIKKSVVAVDRPATYQGFFGRHTTNRKMNSVPPSIGPSAIASTLCNKSIAKDSSNKLANPASLRQELDFRIKKLEKGDDYQWALQHKYPAAIGLMCDYISSLIEHRKPTTTAAPLPATLTAQDAIRKYRQFFSPGSLSFQFQTDVENAPSPNYHLLEGETILHVDWKLAFPSIDLLCYNCKHASSEKVERHLVHDRTNFSKKKSLFPIWTHSGLPTWCILMNYKCEHCKTCYAANDGRLLSLLPRDVASAYPVLPKYASGYFHIHQDLSDDLESLMKTYANGKFISTKLHRKMGVVFTRKLETYLARSPTRSFISYEAFSGGISPPTPAAIRQCFLHAERSQLTAYGFSNFERYERELQSVSVGKDEKMACDWTFQTVKNYRNVPGAKAIFTANKGSTNEILTLAMVPTTAASQISHLLLQMIEKREQFDPAVLYTDTCPHNEAFWKIIFGAALETKLGLFHLMHRIFDTLDPKCDIFWKCLVKLKDAVYSYVEEDEAALLKALKDGSFSKTNEKLSDTEIRDLRHSKRWKERYSAFLRKRILPEDTIRHRLTIWLNEFKNATDERGKSVFSKNTEKVALEQFKKVRHVSDVPNLAMYQRIPPGPRSTHGLSKWKCDRPESPLEKFHELMAHFGNTGMEKELADTLTLGGTTEYNVKQRWKATIRLDGAVANKIPSSFVDLPQFYDHSLLLYLNDAAFKCGLPPIFCDIHPIRENNGEVFLSKYFDAQIGRNNSVKQDPKTKLCLCPTCKARVLAPASPFPQEQVTAASRSIVAAASRSNSNDSTPVSDESSPPQFSQPVIVAQEQPQPSTAAVFVPPIPLAEMAYGAWMPRPHDCCYMVGNYHCATYALYLRRKISGVQVLGKPPHEMTCPVRRHLQR
jgi:hypothetical protein